MAGVNVGETWAIRLRIAPSVAKPSPEATFTRCTTTRARRSSPRRDPGESLPPESIDPAPTRASRPEHDRRISVALSAGGDGVSPSATSWAATKASMGFRLAPAGPGATGTVGRRGATNAQCGSY